MVHTSNYTIARIARTGKLEYFTASSAYDRSKWVSLSEATKYESPELAQNAAKRLWKNGIYEAKVTPLIEVDDALADDLDDKANKKTDMVADKQEKSDVDDKKGVCPDCESDPCECPEGGDEPKLDLDTATTNPTTDNEVGAALDAAKKKSAALDMKEGVNHMGDREQQTYAGWKKACRKAHPTCTFRGDKDIGGAVVDGKDVGEWDGAVGSVYAASVKENADLPSPVTEKVNLPAKPLKDVPTPAASSEFPKVAQVPFKDDVRNGDNDTQPIADAHENKLAVPNHIKSQLKSVISDFHNEAKEVDGEDSVRGSHCLTVAAALQTLADHLAVGTVESMKLAQIHMTKLMSPILNHIPSDVINFVASGGAKRSLKDHFNSKWDKARAQ